MNIAIRALIYAAVFTLLVVLATGAPDVPPEVGTALTYVVTYARFFETYVPVALALRLIGAVLGIELVLALYRNISKIAGRIGGND